MQKRFLILYGKDSILNNTMQKIVVIVFFTTVSLALFGQEKPLWLDENQRERQYPSNTYFTGFAYGEKSPNKEVQEIIQQLKTDAQADLSKKIRLQISSKSQSTMATVNNNGRYQENESFFNQSITQSNAEVVGIKTESYYNPVTKMVYAFAVVKRSDLIAFYQKQINLDLNKVETTLTIAEEYLNAGKKISAFDKCEEAKKMLDALNFYRNLLIAIDGNADDNNLQIERTNKLIRTIEQALITLEQSTFVYLNCQYELKGYKNDAFSSDPGIFCDIITQALSENQCSVTDNKEEADYELTLITSTTQRSDGKGDYGIISYYANVKGSLYSRMTQKKTVEFSIFNDPDAYSVGKSAEDAASKAFKLPELKKKVLDKILLKIKD